MGIEEESKAISSLFTGRVKAVIYTQGSNGSVLYVRDLTFAANGFDVQVQDTTGAGDAFIGAVLYLLLKNNVGPSQLEAYFEKYHEELSKFANACGALRLQEKGQFNLFRRMTRLLN